MDNVFFGLTKAPNTSVSTYIKRGCASDVLSYVIVVWVRKCLDDEVVGLKKERSLTDF